MDMHSSPICLLERLNCYRSNLSRFLPHPQLGPSVADTAPNAETLTSYDEEHLVTYLRLLDAEADGADCTEATRLVLHIDASREPARARRAWESHLARAKWMTEHGYQHLLRGRAPG